jgi:hypothetical protein
MILIIDLEQRWRICDSAFGNTIIVRRHYNAGGWTNQVEGRVVVVVVL